MDDLDRLAFVNDVDVVFCEGAPNVFAVKIGSTAIIVRGGRVMEIVRLKHYARGFGSLKANVFERTVEYTERSNG